MPGPAAARACRRRRPARRWSLRIDAEDVVFLSEDLPDVDVTVRLDTATAAALARGDTRLADAVARGDVVVKGEGPLAVALAC